MSDGELKVGADLVRRRRDAVLLATLVILLLGSSLVASPSAAGPAKTGIVVLLAAVLALRATTRTRLGARRPTLDDELTRENRARAAQAGFLVAFVWAAGAEAASFAIQITGHQVALGAMVLGAAAAGARFSLLEARL